jgi:cysteine-rich repeat protein
MTVALAAALFLVGRPASAGLLPECGNGVVEPPELCDDGNTDAGDCCSPLCLPEPDLDLDGTCDGLDNCPDDANPSQQDTDDDGLGDVCDPCTRFGNTMTERPKLTGFRLGSPAGDERLHYKASIIGLPEGEPLDPLSSGVRLLLENGVGDVLWDVTAPPGPGWKSSGGVFVYRGDDGDPGGIRKLKIKVLSGGAVKLRLKARDATMLGPPTLPIHFTFIATPPLGLTGSCATSSFGGDDDTHCVSLNAGDRLVCK